MDLFICVFLISKMNKDIQHARYFLCFVLLSDVSFPPLTCRSECVNFLFGGIQENIWIFDIKLFFFLTEEKTQEDFFDIHIWYNIKSLCETLRENKTPPCFLKNNCRPQIQQKKQKNFYRKLWTFHLMWVRIRIYIFWCTSVLFG